MAFDPAKSPAPSKARAIVQRTRGRTHGPVTRLMSPSDFGGTLIDDLLWWTAALKTARAGVS